MAAAKLKKPRFSPQREVVLKIVEDSQSHLPVEEILKLARKKHPQISKATVYRDLQQLEELQKICSVQGPRQRTHYESFKPAHHHFICRNCESITNLEAPTVNICVSCITQKTPIKVETVVTTIVGICAACKTLDID